MLLLLTCAQIKMCLGCICLGVCPFEYFGLFKSCQLQWEVYANTLQKVFSTGGQCISLCSPKVLRIIYKKKYAVPSYTFANFPVRGVLMAKSMYITENEQKQLKIFKLDKILLYL